MGAIHVFFPFLILNLFALPAVSPSRDADFEALLAFKAVTDRTPDRKLFSWNATSDYCTWRGVSCLRRRVTRLVLENLDLGAGAGSLEPLTALTDLRVLSLKRNRLVGPIPDLSNLTALKMLFLSHNRFSGGFPPSLTSLSRLYRLDLSHNNFSGELPAALARLTRLLTLRLQGNRFSGRIPGLDLPSLQDLNVSGNLLSGEIPGSLSGYPGSVFAGNPGLCGSPLPKCAGNAPNPARPRPDGAMASPVVASSPTSMPGSAMPGASGPNARRGAGSSKISGLAVAAIVVGDVLVLAVVSALLYCCFWRGYGRGGGGRKAVAEGEKVVYSASPYPGQGGFGSERGRMVFFEGARRFELEDLLRASAEMLGKGGFGTAYKAVLDDGAIVAVKRLRDGKAGGGGGGGGGGAKRGEVEQHMEVLGRLRHPNVVSLRAYYFAREEKLLVYDYMPDGSLFWLLHGNRGPGRTPLDWTTRLKIAAGAARGLAFIHNSGRGAGGSLRLSHGNIKSTNVLLDKSGAARLSDCGVAALAPSAAAHGSNGYRAPESSAAVAASGKISNKSDVYSFGVVLLEMLTGKCPSAADAASLSGGYGGAVAASAAVDLPRWVQSVVREEWTAEVFDLELMRYKDIEEEMVALLQVAMACTAATPDQRPKMSHVVKMIEEIRGGGGEEASPSRETLDSVSDSPSVSEDACGVGQ